MKQLESERNEVVKLSSQLHFLSDRQISRIEKLFKESKLFWGQHNNLFCDCCGHKIHTNIMPSVCPKCGRLISGMHDKFCGRYINHKNIDYFYHTIITTCKGWQLIRTFFCKRYTYRGKPHEFMIEEVHQWWINESGRTYLMSKSVAFNPYNDHWNFYSKMKLIRYRKEYAQRYFRFGYVNAADVRLIPKLKRNGLTKEYAVNMEYPSEQIQKLLVSHELETLLKSGQDKLIEYCLSKRNLIIPSHILRICNKNNFVINEPRAYLCYVDLLEHFKLDTHNSYYLCPANWLESYTQLQKKKEREEQEARIQAEKKRMIAYNETYLKEKHFLLGWTFGDGDLNFHVLQNVNEFYEEGKAMHHCVYQQRYFTSSNSLILSCRDTDDRRIATIEISLNKYKVVQVRGVCNEKPERYNDIVRIINKNMPSLRKLKDSADLLAA